MMPATIFSEILAKMLVIKATYLVSSKLKETETWDRIYQIIRRYIKTEIDDHFKALDLILTF